MNLKTQKRALAIVLWVFALEFFAGNGAAQNTFCWAIAAKGDLKLSGGALVDSFNSQDPSQSTAGQYDVNKRSDGGNVASFSASVGLITDNGNTKVYGRAATLPGGQISLNGRASIGSLAWVNGGNSGIQPGWYSNNLPAMSIPDASLTNAVFSTLKKTPGKINGTNYTYVITSGFYENSANLNLSGNIYISGQVVLYFPSGFQISGNGYVYISPGSKLTIYLGGQAGLSGGGIVNAGGYATNCSVIGLPSCTSIQYGGSSSFIGTIYAPEASFQMAGGGSTSLNFVGAVTADSVSISGSYQFHYDQNLCGCSSPEIVTPPANLTVCPGASATFGVTATGTALTFQWFDGATALAGRTNSSLTITNVSAADAGNYSVAVTSGCGAQVTRGATLTVNTIVSATPLPNLLRYVGSIAVFSTTPSGTSPYTFTWQKNGTNISGQTSSSLTLSNLTVADSGIYTVFVTGACGNTVTETGTLVVDTCFPAVDVMLVLDRSGSMTGKPYFDALAAASNFVQNLHYTNGDQAGLASYNSSATLDQTLTNSLSKLDLAISLVPGAGGLTSVSLGLQTGQNELVSVRHHTNSLPVLVLLSDGMPTGGDTASNALYWATQSKIAGTRIFTVGLGSVNASLLSGIASTTNDYYFTTNSSELTGLFNAISTVICRPPTNIVVTGPSNLTVCAGSTANFSATAAGCGAFRYQWYKGVSALAGQTNNVLTLSNVGASDAGIYSVAVMSDCQNVTNSAALTVNANAIVTVPPSSVTNCPGTTVNFSVSATGTGLSYQWYKGAGLLSGQSGATFTLNNISTSDAGNYDVVVSGMCGNSVTNIATLVVSSNAVVTTPPMDATVCAGMSASFGVNAIGTGILYQWYKGASLVPGKTASTLTLNGVTAADAGVYSVVVSGVCGQAITNSATLFVNANTVVSVPPMNATNCPGTTANFSVNATGTGLTYQWFKGATLLSGKTGSTLTLSGVGSADAGVYSVVISGACGASVTNSATLFVNGNTIVSMPPTNTTVCPGMTVNFSVNAAGAGLTYQWYNATGPITGQTNSTLSLANASAANAGIYSVVINGTCGVPVTNSATLFVNANTIVTAPPMNATVCPGTTANFSVNANGTGLMYQWYKSTGPLNGQTNSTLSLTNVSLLDVGSYSVVVSGLCGVPSTNSATLMVNSNTIVLTPPQNATVCPGMTANFSVGVTGTSFTFQWYNSTGPLGGQTNGTLSLPNVSAADAGVYTVVVRGVCGVPATNSATLFVNATTIVSVPPSNTTNCAGATANFNVNAIGTGLTYQWYKSTGAIAGQTNSTLSLANVTVADAGVYSVVISGVCGAPVTNSATLVVNANTIVSVPPANATNCPGTTANFSVNATGTGLTYQWFKGPTSLNGKTGSTLVLNNVNASDAGVYSVVVSGVCGLPVTNGATLFVNANTIVSVPPTNTTVCSGMTANFGVNATGTGLTYQWFKGTGAIAGQTNSTLSLANVSAAEAGVYSVVINGVCGAPVTNGATLLVNANPIISAPPVDATVCPGATANFSVNASGSGLAYQWFKGTASLNGKTGSTLVLNNVSATDAGVYSVVVSGACGLPVTNSATLFVNANTIVSVPPADATNCAGTVVNFGVNATGTSLTYQWYTSAGPVNGQTNSSLSLTNVSELDAGIYSVVISGACGAPVTNSATLLVNANTIISAPPVDATVCPGATANFSVSATGAGLTYQWFDGATLLNGKKGSTLVLNNVSASDAGVYSVVISGACGVPVTNSAALVVNANTIVSVPPNNTTNCPGTTANFGVNATGTGLAYQWYKSTGPIAGQTNSTLTLANVGLVDVGSYSVVVSGVCGLPVTNSATLFVNSNTVVLAPPTDVTVCPGTTANFAVGATGTDFKFQWYNSAGPLSGQTNSTLSLTNVSAANAGIYRVVVSGVCGVPVTNSAMLFVNANTIVSAPPANATNCPGTTANFSVNATGAGLTYQWYKSTGAIAGQTSSTLSLTNVSLLDVGTYSVVVSGVCGLPVTNSATLSVNSNTVVLAPPQNVTVCPGATANFSVGATGTDFTYQWYNSAGPLSGQTKSTLSLTNVSAGNAGIYTVVVSGVCGVPTTNSATLFVNANTVVFLPPTNVTVCAGMTANFSVNATGTGLSYQWYQGAVPLSGRTNYLLSLPDVGSKDGGVYTAVVSGICGAPVTNSATLAVNTNAVIVTPLANATNCPGTSANFSVNATGTGLLYQWYKGATLLSGHATNVLTLNNVSPADAGTYSVTISGICGLTVTNSAVLVVNTNALVSTAPSNSTNCPGTTANFSVNAIGTGLTYQWYKSTGPLSGQTGSTLTIPTVSAADAGVYTVVISGVCGAPITNNATLTVNQNVSVAPIAGVTNNIGGSVTFTAVPSGAGPFNYQWFRAGTVLTGQTNSTLTLNNVQPQDGGTYIVSVTGACGQAAVTAALLAINLPPTATITYPTNGSVFVEPATFTVLATASDPDGVVTNVQIFSSTNGTNFVLLGQTNNPPYLTIASNLPVGHYTFVARATDNWGATGDSAPVSVDVVPVTPPDLFTIGAITLNTQDGFQWLTNVACNPLNSHANALRIDIHNITNSAIRVVNASGTNNGVPFVISPGAIEPGTCWTNVIKFYDPLAVAFYPILTVQLADPIGVGEPDGTPQAIFSGKFLRDGTFLVEFTTVPGITYYVQYSSDMVHWKTVFPPFAGTGQHLQWIDSGPPETESLPSIRVTRFYRVLLAN